MAKETIKFDVDSATEIYQKVNNIVSGTFDAFIKSFDEWKLKYLKSINRMIALKNFLEDVITATDTMIKDRDGLL